MKITKRNGKVVLYDDEKLARSILRANAEVPEEELSPKAALALADEAFDVAVHGRSIVCTEDIRAATFAILREKGYPRTAEHYLDYEKS
ncbi:MAG: hypothetical protein IK095_00445 [Oscillospiraceae bacterium]|nr:hypothetical protein [Oscillospiraceae bacterium]